METELSARRSTGFDSVIGLHIKRAAYTRNRNFFQLPCKAEVLAPFIECLYLMDLLVQVFTGEFHQ